MRRALPVLVCCLFLTSSLRAQDVILPDGSPLSENGGLIIMRRGDQTIVSFGGALLPRKVRVSTATPEGPVVTRFTMPANSLSPTKQPFPPPTTAPALVRVSIPDPHGIVYVEGQLVRTTADRLLESPPLPLGVDHPLRLSAVFQVGDRIFVEDRTLTLRAGECTAVTFDGSGGVSVLAPQAK